MARLKQCQSNASSNAQATQNTENRTTKEGGLYSPNPLVVVQEVWTILDGGLASLDLNDFGRPWPPPWRSTVVATCQRFPADLCIAAAKEAREIVQSQDRAPNITALYVKKLTELAEVRETVRGELEAS